eukprot:CAMPEP_0173120518 /NCGR_PEP_ID=MMETSP1102-20130122/52607_1 /TAXON_ID=49646 /ORGANISM="Geminigera sp., Strain Caron Lab Isolate" /LENGTH=73 /DNA_ID=CAMNT_0014026687 /DNA_START=13 /DNA_END=234 /DNA_ORIENTATION=-
MKRAVKPLALIDIAIGKLKRASAMVHAKLVLALIVTAIVENVMANPVFFALEKMPHKSLAVHKNGRAANSRHN